MVSIVTVFNYQATLFTKLLSVEPSVVGESDVCEEVWRGERERLANEAFKGFLLVLKHKGVS